MALASPTCLRFGNYELDVRAGKLSRDGIPVKIQPQPLRVLSVLLEHPGETVSREELRSRIWGDATFVEFDQGLNYCIRQIRLALRDDAVAPVYIETLPKQGYRFIAPVTGDLAETPIPPAPVSASPKSRGWLIAGVFALLAVAGASILYNAGSRQSVQQPIAYTQLTSFTDYASGPVLSPDGRMLAFFRSDDKFLTAGEIYVKMLPDGEPVQISHDPRPKYSLAFTPNGSRIAYTVFEKGFSTYTVPILGGDSQLLQPNAAGLIWLDPHRILFSEVKSGVHMGIVSANEDLSDHREIYFPTHERGMAHYTYPSPDHKWALIAEMGPEWKSCRIVPLSGADAGRQVGPGGACNAAAWSPDGQWMYFGVEAQGRRHLWRQRFPNGQPEQITGGSTDADGLAISPDGRSLITSILTKQDAIWIHDSNGDRALSSEGYAGLFRPRFSPDGKRLYYLLKHDSPGSPNELWRADIETGRSEPVVPGVSMRVFSISPDEKEVVFSTNPSGKPSQLWLAPIDRSAQPQLIASTGEDFPSFGPDGTILFRTNEANQYYFAKMKRDGSARAKVFPKPMLDVYAYSPDGSMALLGLSIEGSPPRGAVYAVPTNGGTPRLVCEDVCTAAWSPNGREFFLEIDPAKVFDIPIPLGEILPRLPDGGVSKTEQDPGIPGAKILRREDVGAGLGSIAPGLKSTYAYVKQTTHANLFRIPLAK
jgi:DNA-binding winged helix-turn-helix (wHTH) protein/Tol biopolymer transport system component